jgi:hypothetical protein
MLPSFNVGCGCGKGYVARLRDSGVVPLGGVVFEEVGGGV